MPAKPLSLYSGHTVCQIAAAWVRVGDTRAASRLFRAGNASFGFPDNMPDFTQLSAISNRDQLQGHQKIL
jgi:hypothetical protein